MGDFRRYVGGVVLYSDYTSVQRLFLSIRVQLAFFTDTSGAPWETEAQVGMKPPERQPQDTTGLAHDGNRIRLNKKGNRLNRMST